MHHRKKVGCPERALAPQCGEYNVWGTQCRKQKLAYKLHAAHKKMQLSRNVQKPLLEEQVEDWPLSRKLLCPSSQHSLPSSQTAKARSDILYYALVQGRVAVYWSLCTTETRDLLLKPERAWTCGQYNAI